MATRRESRMWATQVLYQLDFNPVEIDEALLEFWKDKDVDASSRAFTESLVNGVRGNLAEIDERLAGYAENWTLKRMAGCDRNIMRICMYEMVYLDDVPPVVAINEAVDLAKDFGTDDSGRFVNGILDRARKDLDRPARTVESGEDS